MSTEYLSKVEPGITGGKLLRGLFDLIRGKYRINRNSLAAFLWHLNGNVSSLRLNYPLSETSIVVDLGGFKGDFAAAVFDKYQCTVHAYEPMPEFFDFCVDRFKNNSKVRFYGYGLAASEGELNLSVSGDESSFVRPGQSSDSVKAQVRSVVAELEKLNYPSIDLLKINIEGGEYEVLPALIESGWISKIKFLQIQFHKFIPGAEKMRAEIHKSLKVTHKISWSYEFVWESWERL